MISGDRRRGRPLRSAASVPRSRDHLQRHDPAFAGRASSSRSDWPQRTQRTHRSEFGISGFRSENPAAFPHTRDHRQPSICGLGEATYNRTIPRSRDGPKFPPTFAFFAAESPIRNAFRVALRRARGDLGPQSRVRGTTYSLRSAASARPPTTDGVELQDSWKVQDGALPSKIGVSHCL